MERLIIKAILKMCTKAIVLTTMIGIAIGIIGYINKWNSWIAYSNAFFLAGCLVIVAGGCLALLLVKRGITTVTPRGKFSRNEQR